MSQEIISLHGVRVHNLKNISVDIPRNALVVLTGVSGSGKSSLAFDTLYAEGQRRYAESLSAYARQFLNLMPKPDCDSISGLSPAIAIDQRGGAHNPRSTVGTVTEIYDYLRVLYARIGTVYSPTTGSPVSSMSAPQICAHLMETYQNKRLYILAPIAWDSSEEPHSTLLAIQQAGFQRIRVNGRFHEWNEALLPSLTSDTTLAVVIDRCLVRAEQSDRLLDSLEVALRWGKGKIEIYDPVTESVQSYFSSDDWPGAALSLKDITPGLFSFNNPKGACLDCKGVGMHSFFSPNLIVPDSSKSLLEGAIKPWARLGQDGTRHVFKRVTERLNISLTVPFHTLSPRVQKILLTGEQGVFSGVIPHLEQQWRTTESLWLREELSRYQECTVCATCCGTRLRQEALCVKISQQSIADISAFPISTLCQFLQTLSCSAQQARIAEPLLAAIKERLQFLKDVGLEYLTLNRAAYTLSGGESQRIHLVSRLGTGLQGVLYVLDEPSIGLHQRDNERLIKTLQRLRDLGNTVVVVEHDADMIRAADYIIDLGPGAGQHGGDVVCAGALNDVQQCPQSLTGAYFNDTAETAIPPKRRRLSQKKSIRLRNITVHNLHNLEVTIPLGGIIAVSGVSGSGKSSLILETLVPRLQKMLNKKESENISGGEHFERIITVDQTPIGRTPRSNPIIYIGGFSLIRELFASLPTSKARGYTAKRFSFNLKGGRCEACQGEGVKRIEMHFLPPMFVKCDTCQGRRYNLETLSVKFRGKSIADILDMSVAEAIDFFRNFSLTLGKLDVLHQVGLGYITLGQAATTLSGGEAQRVKLAKEIARRQNGKTLYVLDEPTTGLHFEDVKKLLIILHNLADQGNTIIVIEHNLDVLKSVDWIIDLGPEGGDKGGEIIAQGPPEVIARAPHSYTGRALASMLS